MTPPYKGGGFVAGAAAHGPALFDIHPYEETPMPKSNPVVWFEIYVQDLARARKFYETVLGVKLEPLPSPNPNDGFEMLMFPADMHAPGSGGALAKMEGFAPGGNSILVYFACTDCAIEGGRLRPRAPAEDVDRRIRPHRAGHRYRGQYVRVALDGVSQSGEHGEWGTVGPSFPLPLPTPAFYPRLLKLHTPLHAARRSRARARCG
jgi:predicted enzyme related to lactoylglutathione lyase